MIYLIAIPLMFLSGFCWGWFIAQECKITIEKKPVHMFFDETVDTQHGRLPSSWVVKSYDFEDGEVKTTTYKCYTN